MKSEASSFEPSEMLAAFVASTPLLVESFNLCSAVDRRRYAVVRGGDGVAYVAFSGAEINGGFDGELAPINGVFDNLCGCTDGRDSVMVRAGVLELFMSLYSDSSFRNQMVEVMNTSKSIVITGQSIGGAVASLLALWFLCHLQTNSSVICITFGSPMLGNNLFSHAILQERWAGHFCHVLSLHSIETRMLFTPSTPLAASTFWKNTSDQRIVSNGFNECIGPFWPFGTYLLCTNTGAVCVDNGLVVIKLLYLTLLNRSPSSSLADHLGYADLIHKLHNWQIIESRNFMGGHLSESNYEAGITLALESLGIASQESDAEVAKEALKMAKRLGRTRNLNSADLAIGLSKINPLRAQIEWYKTKCDHSDDQMGYYNSFKQRGASKRDFKVNMNRIKLAQFWDSVIDKLETNQLPYDFHKREKWVNASQFYKLLVEPLDIAEYYRNGMHKVKGHYVQYGRERRYKIFDKWWSESGTVTTSRSRFASSTQDSCFWARVEEARDELIKIRVETDGTKFIKIFEHITEFDQYARKLVQNKEVSVDVFAKKSSYTLFLEEFQEFQSQLQLLQLTFPGFVR